MNKYEKAILFKVQMLRVVSIILIILNLAAPLGLNFTWKFSLFQLLETFILIFGGLTSSGYFCINTYKEEEDVVIYEQNTSALLIAFTILRLLEFLYYFTVAKNTINFTMLLILTGLDLLYMIFLFIDKASYGYAVEKTEKILKE